MNVAYPQAAFDNDVTAINGVADLIKGGFQNPEGIRATLRLTVPEYPEHGFIARFEDDLHIEADDGRPADTTVTMPIDTIRRIFAEFELLDFRDPSIIGTMSFEGNMDYANHLGKSCFRPSNWTLDRFKHVAALHKQNGYIQITEIEYLHDPTQMQILEVMAESRPVVITGLEPTPLCQDWTIDKLAEKYGDSVVRVRSATDHQNMRDFVQELKDFQANPHDQITQAFQKPYTEGAAMPEAMWEDFGPLFFDREDFTPPQLWLGSVPTHMPTSSLHRDPLTGFLLQVIGRKRLDLYSADQEAFIYPHKAYNNYQPCWFKPEKPDFDRYPQAEQAKCISVTLNPGELLVQPAGWFHQVYALDSPNMSVSYFWRY